MFRSLLHFHKLNLFFTNSLYKIRKISIIWENLNQPPDILYFFFRTCIHQIRSSLWKPLNVYLQMKNYFHFNLTQEFFNFILRSSSSPWDFFFFFLRNRKTALVRDVISDRLFYVYKKIFVTLCCLQTAKAMEVAVDCSRCKYSYRLEQRDTLLHRWMIHKFSTLFMEVNLLWYKDFGTCLHYIRFRNHQFLFCFPAKLLWTYSVQCFFLFVCLHGSNLWENRIFRSFLDKSQIWNFDHVHKSGDTAIVKGY